MVPGITAKHAIITPSCRKISGAQRGPGMRHLTPEMAAFEVAVSRLREEYLAICKVRDDGFMAHVVLSVETVE